MDERAVDVRLQVREFVTGNFYVPERESLRDSMSLLEAGVVDSTGVLEIMGFLQATFGFTVEDDEIVPENLDSIENIARYVMRKKAWS